MNSFNKFQDLRKKIKLTVACFFYWFSPIIAQDIPSFSDDVIDNTPAAPINNYIIPMLFLGVLIGYKATKSIKKLNS